jgi:tetratricopeptide (TPR) repeat protein
MKQIILPFRKSLAILTISSSILATSTAFSAPEAAIQTNFPSQSDAQNEEFHEIYQIGLDALKQEDYLRARATFSSILRYQRSFLKLNRSYYFSTQINLAVSESNLANFKEADAILNRLRKESPPDKALITIEGFRARLKYKKGETNEAFLILYNLEKQTDATLWEKEELAFFNSVENRLNQHYQDLLSQAEKMSQSSLFDLAVPLYYEVLQAIEKNQYPQELREEERYNAISLKLANSYFQSNQFEKALSSLRKIEDEQDELYPEKTFLTALCHQSLNSYDKSLVYFEEYLKLGLPRELPRFSQAKLQLGISYYRQGKFAVSQTHLNFFNPQGFSQEKLLAKTYLAKISLKEKRFDDFKKELDFLNRKVSSKNPLFFELAFLQGEALFQQGDFPQAIGYYEQAIPHKNKDQAKWYLHTLYNLAWCYLQLGNEEGQGKVVKKQLFEKAELILNELIAYEKTPEASLALARLYLVQEEQAEKVEFLLGNTHFEKIQDQAEALYLRARASVDKDLQQKLFAKLSGEAFASSSFHDLAWFFQGTHFFDLAQDLQSKDQLKEAQKFYEKSTHFLTKAFKFLKDNDKEKASQAIKYTIYAYHHLNTNEAKFQALSLIKKLFQDHAEIAQLIVDTDEILYLEASIAASLLGEKQNLPFLKTIEGVKERILDSSPHSLYADKILHLSGIVHFQLQKYEQTIEDFQLLSTNYPNSPHIPEALFWLAEASEWLEKDPAIIKSLRKRIFTDHTMASFADEAYFNYYSFSEYLQSKEEAFNHLQEMPSQFPQSNFTIVAHYLIGLHHKQENLSEDTTLEDSRDLSAAFTAFMNSKDLFSNNLKQNTIPKDSLAYFTDIYFKSLSELPSIRFIQAFHASGTQKRVLLEQATNLYQELIQELEDPNGLYYQFLSQTNYPPLLEQSHYELAKLHLQSKQEDQAELIFNKMQSKQRKLQQKHGYYLSRVWYHLGEIKTSKLEHQEALNNFLESEKAAKGKVLSTDKKLDLWLKIARSHQNLNQLDEAMLMLSKVINEFVSSDLRIEAMYLRALIYEQQGKKEFAIKQLESTSKKTGEWAAKAQDKLRQDYGFQ